jgi:hypothetical protein
MHDAAAVSPVVTRSCLHKDHAVMSLVMGLNFTDSGDPSNAPPGGGYNHNAGTPVPDFISY